MEAINHMQHVLDMILCKEGVVEALHAAHKAGEKYNIYKQSIYHILQRYLHDDNDGVLSLTLFWNVTFSAMLLIWPVSMKV